MIRPSPQTTIIGVTCGLLEVEKCLAAKSTRQSSSIGGDCDKALNSETSLALDHSDTRTQRSLLYSSRLFGPLNIIHRSSNAVITRKMRNGTFCCHHVRMWLNRWQVLERWMKMTIRSSKESIFTELLTFARFAIGLQGEPYGATATDPSCRIFTCPVTATVVYGTGLCRWRDRDI